MSDAVVKTQDFATPLLKEALATMTTGRRALLMSVAGATRQRLRAHFRARQAGDSKRKRRGWAPKYFWSGSRGQSVEENTQIGTVTSDSATVVIASPAFAMKLKGGTITPKRGKFLAMPLRAEAYAAGSPREWDNQTIRSEMRLVPIRSKSGNLFLAQVGDGNLRGLLGGSGLRLQYLLVRKVEQKADPNALPSEAEMGETIDKATDDHITRRLSRVPKNKPEGTK